MDEDETSQIMKRKVRVNRSRVRPTSRTLVSPREETGVR